MKTTLNTATSFNGRFSPQTLAKFRENLPAKQFKKIENFRTGKRFTNIDIVTVQNAPERLPNGVVIMPKETFAEISNIKSKTGARARIKLADKELPFNMDTFKMITDDVVARGEQLLKRFK